MGLNKKEKQTVSGNTGLVTGRGRKALFIKQSYNPAKQPEVFLKVIRKV
jgi:hypothetical protein